MKEITIKDGQPYLGELYNIKFKSAEHFYTYDNRANIKEFENYKFERVHGSTGNGPCEHGSINNFTVFQDSLFLLDRAQGKYLKYDTTVDSYKNCVEFFNEIVVRLSGIQAYKGSTFFIRGSLVKSLPSDAPIIYRFQNETDKIVATNVLLKDLQIKLSGVPLQLSMASDKKEQNLIFYLPLTRKIFIYDTVNGSLEHINVDLYIAEDQNIYEEKNLQKFSELLSNEIEVVFDLFALEEGVVLGYRKGTGEDQIWGIKMFSYEGNKIADKKLDNRVVYMDQNGTLFTLVLQTDRENNPYSFHHFEYTLE